MAGRIVVTGGAGFIGSCMVRELNDHGFHDIIVVDHIAKSDKWKNLSNKSFCEYVNKYRFINSLLSNEYGMIDAIIHLGACSSTTEKDFDYLWDNNVDYTKRLWMYCVDHNTRMIYASSAATYGNGSNGFDDKTDIERFIPMNGYGYSKHAFDLWAQKQEKTPAQHVGLKFFNVYGPNEYFKGSMASMIFHGYRQIKEDGIIRLFKSYKKEYEDGGQLRDFVYVKDVCDVIMYFFEHPDCNGLFNVGTGKSRSFEDLAKATFRALKKEPNVQYIDMPEQLIDKYQYFTEADITLLRCAGYKKPFTSIEDGAEDYVCEYLDKDYRIY